MFPDTFAAVLLRTDDIPDVYVFVWDDATVAERLTAEADDEAVEATDELRLYPDEDEADDDVPRMPEVPLLTVDLPPDTVVCPELPLETYCLTELLPEVLCP